MRNRPVASVLIAMAGLAATALPGPARAAEPTVEDLLRRTDDLLRGKSSRGRFTMRVKTARWDRSLGLEAWSEGTEKTLIRITSPAREAGTATLKVEQNIWNYLPKVDRTIKVPASMMSGNWMGSHFTNDDLVRESRFVDDYRCACTSRPRENKEGVFVVSCVPKPNAPVVWGKVILAIGQDELIQKVDHYDEKGRLIRTLHYTDLGDLGGRRLPRRMRMVPHDKPGELTEVVYEELTFDVALPAGTFTLQALRR
jgi:hypothetical protein